MSGVVIDLSFHPSVCWAVVWIGRLLPVRFGTQGEAGDHLYALQAGSREAA